MSNTENTTEIFNQYRGLLFSIAYRMLSSATDAEDIVQEAFVRWLQVDTAEVQSPKAYLASVVVRLCIDQLRSSKAQRELYVGTWLPEPMPTGPNQGLEETAILAESLSFAFLIMLESLGPLERAVFLLREVFDYNYAEIAEVVEKSEANCRQILHRAHQHLGNRRPRFETSYAQQERIATQFLRATVNGDMQGLLDLLTEDIVFTADAGGKAQVAPKPVRGRSNVARGTLGGLRFLSGSVDLRVEQVNSQPALVAYVDGKLYGMVILDVIGEHIQHVYAVLNPDKLRWLEAGGEGQRLEARGEGPEARGNRS